MSWTLKIDYRHLSFLKILLANVNRWKLILRIRASSACKIEASSSFPFQSLKQIGWKVYFRIFVCCFLMNWLAIYKANRFVRWDEDRWKQSRLCVGDRLHVDLELHQHDLYLVEIVVHALQITWRKTHADHQSISVITKRDLSNGFPSPLSHCRQQQDADGSLSK